MKKLFSKSNKCSSEEGANFTNPIINESYNNEDEINYKSENNKRKLVTITYGLLVVLILVGASYALFDYSFLGSRNDISRDEIVVDFLESSSEYLGVTNSIPISDTEGMAQQKTYDFQVSTKTANEMAIGYKLTIKKLEASPGYTNLDDSMVKVYLTDYNDNVVVPPTLVSDLENYVLYEHLNSHDEENSLYKDKYKIRIWIDGNVTGEDLGTEDNLQYNFEIDVDFIEKQTTNSVSDLSVSLLNAKYTYDGSAKTPEVLVKDRSKVLVEGTDYTVTYKDNTNAGAASAVITGKGDYTGTVTKKFIIGKAESVCSISTMPSLEYAKNATGNIVYNCTGDGKVSLVSSDENLIEVGEITDKNVQITALKSGEGTVTLKQAEGSNYKKSNEVTKDISVGLSSYTVNVTVQNGSVDTASKSIKYGANGSFTISASTGYGTPTVSCTNSQSASISGSTLTVSNVTKDTTCTVTYKANTYTITLNGNGATTNGTTSVTATYNSSSISPSTITIPKRSYTVSGFNANSTGATISSTSTLTSTYTFNGWYTGTSGGSKVINNSSTPAYVASVSGYTDANSKWIKASAATLYAQWSSASVTLPTVTKTGYTCKWNTASNGSGTTYNSGATITPSANISALYAICTAHTYTVEYYSYDGGTKYGNSSHTYGSAKSLTAIGSLSNVTTPTGKTFYGWATSANSTTKAYSDGQSVSNLTSTIGGTVKLYAIWRSAGVTLTYKSGINSATSSTSSTYYYYNGATSVAITTGTPASITNWTALGWRDDTTAGAKEYSSATSTNFSASTTLYGVYSRSYTANFYSGASKATTTTVTSSTAYYNSSQTAVPTTVSLTTASATNSTDISNWTELGWRDDTTAGAKEYSYAASVTVAFGTDFYSVYSRTLTISYNGNSSTGGSTSSTTKTVYLNSNSTTTSSQAVTLASNGFTKTGYTFSKWTAGSTSGTEYSAGASYTAGVSYNASTFGTTMYAKWTINTYTLTVNPNGGSFNGSTSNTTYTQNYNSVKVLPKPTKTGYTFAGWTLSGSGSLSKYGTGLFNDEIFSSGTNSFSVYNNSANSMVSHSRIATSTDNPMKAATNMMQIKTSGTASPGLGGYVQYVTSKSGGIFYHVIVAKIPKGYTIAQANNSTGTGGTFTWLTPRSGTGQFETYIYRANNGTSGTFSTFGHVYLTGTAATESNPVTWYVAYSNMFDATNGTSNENISQVYTYGTSNTTLTAKWVAGTYTVTLNGNGATTSGTTSVTATYNSSSISPSTITIPKRAYTVSGFGTADSRNSTGATISSTSTLTSTYTFNGWHTATSGGSKVISNSTTPAYIASVSGYTDANSKWIKAGTATLYAQWSSASVKLPTITKTGYTCGWTTSSSGTTISYASGATYTPTANTPLYAVCKINSYTVNVVVQNGTVDTASKTIEYKKSGTFNLTPTVSGTSATVTCTNSQTGSITNNVLTVSNVTNNTTCTVKYNTVEKTTLYTDGTLIINENLANRSSNITKHGAVTNEYEAMSSSNSYVFSYTSTPWNNEKTSVTSVEIGSNIKPVSTAYWAQGLKNMTTGDFTKLDVGRVTDMSSMFDGAGSNATTFNLIGLNTWRMSAVNHMDYMFKGAGSSATTFNIGDLSSWNTQNVMGMSYMFYQAGFRATTFNIGDLSSWRTSRVEDMSYMFMNAGHSATTFSIGDLSSWNTSFVEDMSYMFYGAGYNATWSLNCSGWNVDNVVSYKGFNNAVTSKVIAPTWVN